MKKLINLDCLVYYHCRTCFISNDSLKAGVGQTFDLICIICKSYSRIL